jgi:L-2,4-diaminobutyric acid acetyltransferase
MVNTDSSKDIGLGSNTTDILIRTPVIKDGMAVHNLIANCPPLDTNSSYCNFLQCLHFADTCALAEKDGHPIAFVSGYRDPRKNDTLFIWQVAVGEEARGHGLAQRLLHDIVSRPEMSDIRFIQTTISPDNAASWAVFQRLADQLKAESERSLLFGRVEHFNGEHDDEMLLSIGPLPRSSES